MSNSANVAFNVVATGLVSLGVTSITSNFWQGVIEVALGIVLYAVYEFIPTKPQ
jgi:hypothetical protein